MYTAFFGLQRDPFTISPDPRFLFLSERHAEALAHLLYGAQGAGGIVLLTGDIGTGKTTVCRQFLEQAPAEGQVAYIFNPRLSVNELLQSIADEFGYAVPRPRDREPTIKELVDPLNRFLLVAHAAGRNPILIIDEAQNLSPEVLEQLRLLTNLETHERKLLQIVLIGQPELRNLLARPGLEQLEQRVVARFHLGPLNLAETVQYIEHRMRVAGLTGPTPFSPRAMRRIHRLSGGVPRKINLLCGRALLGIYGQGQRSANPAVIDRAAAEVFGPAQAGSQDVRRSALILSAGALAGAGVTALVLISLLKEQPAAGSATTAMPAPAPVPTVPKPSPVSAPAEQRPAATVVPPSPPPEVSQAPAEAGLFRSESQGVAALGKRWSLTLSGSSPCQQALREGVQCYRTARMSLFGARKMDRPALVRLKFPDSNGYAVLEGANATRVVLSANGHRWTVDASRLTKHWSGEYLTLWKQPPGQQGRLTDGMAGPGANWIDRQLKDLQQLGQIDRDAKSAAARLTSFQRSQGLEVDGRATSATLILLNRAVGVTEPRLVPVSVD
ncbi:MAG: AAA family ATPase [Hydrogenophaga sp.]|nr:AAA family ATPase [Hydrogenophaga sp.]